MQHLIPRPIFIIEKNYKTQTNRRYTSLAQKKNLTTIFLNRLLELKEMAVKP